MKKRGNKKLNARNRKLNRRRISGKKNSGASNKLFKIKQEGRKDKKKIIKRH
jgi:hypothetical protein